jgi:hypothetical protein
VTHAIGLFARALLCSLAFGFLLPSTTLAQSSSDDDAVLQPAEPDFRVVNTPTTLRLPLFKSNFELTHRFEGNLRRGDFGDQASNLFGLDEGAVVGLEYRFAVARHLQAAVYRTGLGKTVQFYGKYDGLRQGETMPVSVSALVSVEGTNNFQEDRAPAVGAVVSRLIGQTAAVYVAPIWVHNTAAVLDVTRETFYAGIGARLRVLSTVYVSGEISPRLAGYRPDQHEFAFAIEKRAGGHLFQLNFSNTFATTFGQVARGGFPESLYLGFNLSRKFF